MKLQPQRIDLVGGWTNPCEKYAPPKWVQFFFPNFRGENIPKICEINHHPAMYMVLNFPVLVLFFYCTKPAVFGVWKSDPPLPCLGCSSMVMGKSTRCISPRRKKAVDKMLMDAEKNIEFSKVVSTHRTGTHPEQPPKPLPTGYKGIPFIVG